MRLSARFSASKIPSKTPHFFLICGDDLRNSCRLNIHVLEMENPPQWRVREAKLLFGFCHGRLHRTFRAGFTAVHVLQADFRQNHDFFKIIQPWRPAKTPLAKILLAWNSCSRSALIRCAPGRENSYCFQLLPLKPEQEFAWNML